MTSDATISVITPTADQPTGLALLERYMQRQTMRPTEWIVADDGLVPAVLNCGQKHVRRERTSEGGASLAENLLAALEVASGDIIAIFEHDDWYAPIHLEFLTSRVAQRGKATGSMKQRYFNVAARKYRLMDNVGSCLCNTVFSRELVPVMKQACKRVLRQKTICVDRFFWDALSNAQKDIHNINTVVGIKGLPGRKGLGIGHRPEGPKWHADPNLERLREWIGDDVRNYEDLNA